MWEPVLDHTLVRAFGRFTEDMVILPPCWHRGLHRPQYTVTW